jgi:hypothetical protein
MEIANVEENVVHLPCLEHSGTAIQTHKARGLEVQHLACTLKSFGSSLGSFHVLSQLRAVKRPC